MAKKFNILQTSFLENLEKNIKLFEETKLINEVEAWRELSGNWQLGNCAVVHKGGPHENNIFYGYSRKFKIIHNQPELSNIERIDNDRYNKEFLIVDYNNYKVDNKQIFELDV